MKNINNGKVPAIFSVQSLEKTVGQVYFSRNFACLAGKIRYSWAILFLLAFSVQAQTSYYYLNRSFSAVQFDMQGIPTEYQLSAESDKLTDIVKGEIKLNTNGTYAIEKQTAIALGYGSALSAWNAAMAYNGTPSNYPGKTFDNVGWVRGTRSVSADWGAYIWTLQNKITFQSSTSVWWTSTNGIPVAISNVMVGSLGDYGPVSNVVDIGPVIPSNFPGANCSDSGTYQVDITNVFYQLSIPDIWITPRDAVTCVGGSNMQFTVTGTNIPQGVTWSLIPDLSGSGGAAIQSNGVWQAEITPGNVATNYKVRATSKDNTNFYDQVDLTVFKVDIVESNVYVGVSNATTLHLTPDSSANVQWDITPDLQDGASIEGSTVGTSIVFNAGSVPTNYTVLAYISNFTNCYDTCTVAVIKVEMITPAGDPTNAPVNSGDGQNEFTFSTNSLGVLEVNLKAKVLPSGMATQVASRCRFYVDTIGDSTLAWDSVNPNGVPIASNDFLLAKSTFTGLPSDNTAFGSKKATVCFDATKQDEKPYEVFFAKWAKNHGGGSATDPNWFFYWQNGGVCGIGTNCIYDGSRPDDYGCCFPGTADTFIHLCPWAPQINSGPESYFSNRASEGYGTSTNGEIIVTGHGQGIQCVAETIQHEQEHLNIYNQFNGQTDTDGDGIRDTSETTNSATSYGGVTSDPTNANTYNMGAIYGSYGDNEIRCRKIELNLTISIHPNLDWANPGCQSKNKCGP